MRHDGVEERRWTPEDAATLCTLWGQGLRASAIAKRMGRSRNSVIGKANRLELRKSVADPAIEISPECLALDEKLADLFERPVSIAVMDVTNNDCRWPIDSGRSYEPRCCGHRVMEGKSYCERHQVISTRGMKAWERAMSSYATVK